MNRVIMVGNLTKDPELSETPNGIKVCRFGIAVQRKYGNEQGKKEADFFNVIAWRGLAESVAKYLEKGSKAGVSGSLQTRTYDANDGSKRYATEIVADEVEFLSQRKTENARPSVDELPPIDDPDLPF
jgi:single-strand binding protein|nr:MAG TPA: Single strand binding protein [Caudoviricetes sp.]